MTSELIQNMLTSLANNIHHDSTLARYLFSKLVTQIIIEVSSECNRKCAYCPQSLITRSNAIMPDEILNKILSDLSRINYSKHICLNLYNEPLLHFEHLINTITHIKNILPKSNIFFSSNGDMLTTNRLQQLKSAGLDKIIITHHPKNASTWITEKIKDEIISQAEELNIAIDKLIINEDKSIHLFTKLDTLTIEIFSLNFITEGVNRAGALQIIKNNASLPRTKPCTRPSHDLCISYDGSVYPCCQFFHGLDLHKKFRMGDVTHSNIFDIYYTKNMRIFRKMALKNGQKPSPCDTCAE